MSGTTIFTHLISYKKAKSMGLKRYFTGKSCKNGHVAERCIHTRMCIVCDTIRKQNWYKNNIEICKQRNNNYYLNNKDECDARSRKYYKNNSERLRNMGRKHYIKNRDRYYYWNYKRRIDQMDRTMFGYEDEISEIYKEACTRRENGEDVHVDHIIPLRGELVSGLHVPWNLQIIPASDNRSKSNLFTPYVEYH